MNEADVIKRCKAIATKQGVPFIRLTFGAGVQVGWPDFCFLIPGGRPWFVEFKAPGKKPTKRQEYRIRLLRDFGYDVSVCDDAGEFGYDLLDRLEKWP